jgi:Kdo2-lipid IVA lauroyltransferase/acyltransferase
VKLAVITRTLRGRLNEALIGLRREVGVAVVKDRDSAGDALRRLRAGETLAVAVDQNMRPNRGIFVDFFGTPACTTPAAAVMSLRTGAPLIAAFPVRQPDGTHRVVVQGPFAPPEGAKGHQAVVALTQQITHAVEQMVREHPEHWYWLHRRWKTRP